MGLLEILSKIRDFYFKYKFQSNIILINVVVLSPMLLVPLGWVDELPNFYIAILFFYFLFIFIAVISMSDSQRSGKKHWLLLDDYEDYYKNGDTNNRHTYSYSDYDSARTDAFFEKRAMGGLSKSQVNRKKKKIRENLKKDIYLKKKYDL
jgi:hypothetical protein